MATNSARPRHGLAGLVALGCTAVLLAGCSLYEGPAGNTDEAERVTETVVEIVPQPHEESSDETKNAAEQDAKHPVTITKESGNDAHGTSCKDTPARNPLTGEVPIPIHFANSDTTDGRFYYAPAEGAVNPCIPLSWVRLAGTMGQKGHGPGSTTGSFTETVALFGDGHLITDPAPILARRINSVEQIDKRTIRVNYAFYNDQPAVLGETTPASATFHWDGSQVTVSNNTLPLELNQTAMTLDLTGVE